MIQKVSEELLWGHIVARAWCDEALMRRLRSAPRGVLAEHGMEAPEGREVQVVEGEEVKMEDAGTVRRFTFTPSPPMS